MSLLEPARIITKAALVLKELQASASWKAALEAATVASTPLLVTSIAPAATGGHKRLRLPDYFIVAILRGNGISARFAHDAETGNLLEAEGVRKAGATLRPYVDPLSIVRSQISGSSKDASGAEAVPTPVAVWKPCRQSTTRFAPFWRFQFEDRALYVRTDGKTFSELTVGGRG